MAHAQKTDFVFRRNGRVHLNRRGRQFSRMLAAEVCASALVMLDSPCSEVVRRVLATHSIRSFPFTSPPVRHRVPSGFKRTLLPRSTIIIIIGIQPLGRSGQRPELSGDWYSSGTLHPGQVLRGSLPLLSPAFLDVPTFHHHVPPRPPRRERSQMRKWELWARMLSGNFA